MKFARQEAESAISSLQLLPCRVLHKDLIASKRVRWSSAMRARIV